MAYFKCKNRLYRWEKWDSLYQYIQSTTDVSNPDYGYSSANRYYYTKASGYSFNPTTGQFTITGATRGFVNVNGGLMVAEAYQYTLFQDSTVGGTMYQPLGGYLYIRGNNPPTSYKIVANGTIREYRAGAGSYIKGNTNYGNVVSTTKNAFPDNGRASDGYWYVKIA